VGLCNPAIRRPVDDDPGVAAAWLHDIGYARPLRRSGFHPLDGACHLLENGWPVTVAGLVAHHSAARFVAAARGLAHLMSSFPAQRYATGPVADALTYATRPPDPTGSRCASRPGSRRCSAGTARTAPARGRTRSGRRPSGPRWRAPPGG
jgi:hypothetical protein